MGRSVARNNEARATRREEILEAALREFAMAGYGATKVSDIARAGGLSQGLLYNYFDSKDAVYVALVRRGFSRLIEATRQLVAMEVSAGEKIALALELLLAEGEGSERFAHNILLLAEAAISLRVPADARAVVEESREVPYALMAEVFRAAQLEGVVREGDPDDLAVLFWSMIRGLALSRATRGRVFERSGPELLKNVFLIETP
jgi:AcrR family transcriptional regulator